MQTVSSPFLRYVVSLILGMLLANQLRLPKEMLVCVLLLSLLLISVLVSFLLKRKPIRGYALWTGIAASLLLISLGYLRLENHEKRLNNAQYIFPAQTKAFLFRLGGPPEPKANSWMLPGRVQAVRDTAGNWLSRDAKLNLYLSATHKPSVQPGQELFVEAKPRLIVSQMNPEAFDYARYARLNHLYWQAFSSNYYVLDTDEKNWNLWLEAKRAKLATILSGYFPDSIGGILQALVLGYRHDIDRQVKETFAGTGTLHILAVSGLHVGLVYGVLLCFFGRYRYSPSGRWLFPLLSGFCLFLYAALTGFAPSVLRAALMFWLFAVADGLQGGRNRLNTLALSAFILLLADPHLLFKAGFQLSYAAVLGIILLVPKLSAPFRQANRFVYRLGQLLAVTLAAQLFTFPISLYYFGQFPVYFFLANLLVVPLAGFLLYGGLLVLLFHGVLPVLASFLAKLTAGLLNGLLWYMQLLQGLPSGQLSVSITLAESVILYLLIGLLLAAWHYRKPIILLSGGLTFLLLLGLVYERSEANSATRRLIVYQQTGNGIIHLLAGRKELVIATDSLSANSEAFLLEPVRRAFQVNRTAKDAELEQIQKRLDEGILCYWQGKVILQLNGLPKRKPPPQTVPLDLLIISENALWNAEDILNYYYPQAIILDQSNSKFRREKLGKAFKSLNFEVHDIARQGAFTYYF